MTLTVERERNKFAAFNFLCNALCNVCSLLLVMGSHHLMTVNDFYYCVISTLACSINPVKLLFYVNIISLTPSLIFNF